jgi:hypothetical protein
MGGGVRDGSDQSTAVWQAQGMISVQVPCTLDEALLLMRARAQSSGQTLEYVATAVIVGDIRFA